MSEVIADGGSYHLYVLLCDHKVLYTGIALDPGKRLLQHQQGAPYGAKFTRRFQQLQLVYQLKVGDKSAALQLEIKLKKCSPAKKRAIVAAQPDLAELRTWLSA